MTWNYIINNVHEYVFLAAKSSAVGSLTWLVPQQQGFDFWHTITYYLFRDEWVMFYWQFANDFYANNIKPLTRSLKQKLDPLAPLITWYSLKPWTYF